MKTKTVKASNEGLYNSLCELGVKKQVALELYNLHGFCKYPKFMIGNEKTTKFCGETLYVLTNRDALDAKRLLELAGKERGGSVVVMSPYGNREVYDMCMRLVDQKKYTSIDRRNYMIFFCDRTLSAQHFKL